MNVSTTEKIKKGKAMYKMKGLFIPEITAEMFRNGCLESIESLMAEGEIYDIDYSPWIPVSERLPENHKDVLICLSSNQICIGCYNSHRLPFRNNVIGWGADHVHNWCSNDVIAWMPLPEPYKASPAGEEVE